MGTSCKGKLIIKVVKKTREVDGKKEEFTDIVQYRGRNKRKQMMKKLSDKVPTYSNPYRVPRSKREIVK